MYMYHIKSMASWNYKFIHPVRLVFNQLPIRYQHGGYKCLLQGGTTSTYWSKSPCVFFSTLNQCAPVKEPVFKVQTYSDKQCCDSSETNPYSSAYKFANVNIMCDNIFRNHSSHLLSHIGDRHWKQRGLASNQLFSYNAVKKQHYQSCRMYSSDSDDHNGQVKGVVFTLPNPWTYLKNIWHLYRLRQSYDPQFNVTEFLSGVKQALCVVTQLIAEGDFQALYRQHMVQQQVAEQIQQVVSVWDEGTRRSIALHLPDISMIKLKRITVYELPESTFVKADIFTVALKRTKSGPLFLQLGLSFQRDLDDVPGDWIISSVTTFQMKEL